MARVNVLVEREGESDADWMWLMDLLMKVFARNRAQGGVGVEVSDTETTDTTLLFAITVRR